jgi:2-keto-4-pentenoate hydratase/2-oxohepta-3-ene-1,7-dioic acid hydratase in catechol pathway
LKIVLFDDYRLGVVSGDRVIDASVAVAGHEFKDPQHIIDLVIAQWPTTRAAIETAVAGKSGVALDSVELRAPVPRPSKIVCAAVNYLEFGQRSAAEFDAFIKSSASVIGSGGTVILPPVDATIFHHEAELAAVIGKRCKNVTRDEALDYVFGYVQFLDISARGIAPNGRHSFFLGKSWDTFGPMGPALVTADEIPDPQALQVRLWNNDEPRHDFPTSDMARSVAELIESLSQIVTLEPGDVVPTGVNHQQIGAIQDGDEIRMEVDGFGPPLVVHVSDPQGRSWPRGVDTEFATAVLSR